MPLPLEVKGLGPIASFVRWKDMLYLLMTSGLDKI
jgi:hypothetical protein